LQAVDERIVAFKPKKADFANAASMPLVVLTAWEGIFENMKISENAAENKGKTILVVGGGNHIIYYFSKYFFYIKLEAWDQ
jgi:NADPH2:quinone reductase